MLPLARPIRQNKPLGRKNKRRPEPLSLSVTKLLKYMLMIVVMTSAVSTPT